MITIQYHPELVEQVVRLAACRDALIENELHRAVDPIYELPDGEDREARFRRIFIEWFTRLKLDRFCDELLANFPGIVEQVPVGIVRLAPKRRSQGAELFVCSGPDTPRRTLVMQVCPESLLDSEALHDDMLRELQHVEDMLDQRFGYVPEEFDGVPARRRAVQDRYRVLWDMRVEASLARRGLLRRSNADRLREQFGRAFTIAGTPPQGDVFDRLFEQNSASHAHLAAWSKDPRGWLRDPVVSRSSFSVCGGEPCPMCGFPTFDWQMLSEKQCRRMIRRIRERVPDWTIGDGICRQCVEMLQSGVPQARVRRASCASPGRNPD